MEQPIAFEPPPMQAISMSGDGPRPRHLLAGFPADHGLEIAHHHRIGMRARRRSDAVERVVDVSDPVTQRFVHRIFQRPRAGPDGPDFRAEHFHAEHVRLLPLDVDRAHIEFQRI